MVRHDFQEMDDMMATGELFAAWKQWVDEVMPDAAPMSFATKAETEAGEFHVEWARMGGARMPHLYPQGSPAMVEEAVDVIACAFAFIVRRNGYEGFLGAMRAKLEKNKARKFVLQPDGTYQHVKEEA